MLKQLDQYIVGQEQAKTCLVLAIRDRWRTAQLNTSERKHIQNPNVLLKGPTGSGKTLTASTAANLFGLPIYITPVTRFTQVGYVGEDTREIVTEFVDQNSKKPLPEWYVKELRAKRKKSEVTQLKRKSNKKQKVKDYSTENLVLSYKTANMAVKKKIIAAVLKFKNELVGKEITDNGFRNQFAKYLTDKNLDKDYSLTSFCVVGVCIELKKTFSKDECTLTLRKILLELFDNHGNLFNYRKGHEVITGKPPERKGGYVEDLMTRLEDLPKSKQRKLYEVLHGDSYSIYSKYMPKDEFVKMIESDLPIMDLTDTVNASAVGGLRYHMSTMVGGFDLGKLSLGGKPIENNKIAIGAVLEAYLTTLNNTFDVKEFRSAIATFEEGIKTDNAISSGSIKEPPFKPTDKERLTYLQQYGIIFLDEIDKLADRRGDNVGGFGVQRELLTMLEGQKFQTSLGVIDTKDILFVTAGAFASVKESDLMPELLGRLAIRGTLKPLNEKDLTNIVNNSVNGHLWQVAVKLKTEGVDLTFDPEVPNLIAKYTHLWNMIQENYGARRLSDILTKVVTPISLIAHTLKGQKVVITKEELNKNLTDDRLALEALAKVIGLPLDDLLNGKLTDADILEAKTKIGIEKAIKLIKEEKLKEAKPLSNPLTTDE